MLVLDKHVIYLTEPLVQLSLFGYNILTESELLMYFYDIRHKLVRNYSTEKLYNTRLDQSYILFC